MLFENEFFVPLPTSAALELLTDVQRVAPSMPGARLTSVAGDLFEGEVHVRVGPMSLTYKGTGRLTGVDKEQMCARIEANGRDNRGGGSVSAGIDAILAEVESGTQVTVKTDVDISGKPAQFGRHIIANVGEQIVDQFANNLIDSLTEPPEIRLKDRQDNCDIHFDEASDDVLDIRAIGGKALHRHFAFSLLVVIGAAAAAWFAIRRKE